MHDIMGKKPRKNGEITWALEMKRDGFRTGATTVRYKGREYYKGLGFYPGVNKIFIKSIVGMLKEFEF